VPLDRPFELSARTAVVRAAPIGVLRQCRCANFLLGFRHYIADAFDRPGIELFGMLIGDQSPALTRLLAAGRAIGLIGGQATSAPIPNTPVAKLPPQDIL